MNEVPVIVNRGLADLASRRPPVRGLTVLAAGNVCAACAAWLAGCAPLAAANLAALVAVLAVIDRRNRS